MERDLRVAEWTFQPKLNSVVGKGKTAHVEPQVMQVLVYLGAHAGDAVDKERILQAVWTDTFVTDDVLTRAICELRRFFEEDPKVPRYIETIPKSGYRLVTPVAAVSVPPRATAVGEWH